MRSRTLRKPHRVELKVEELEPRLAPATLGSATTVTYQDIDGDTVTVRLSKPLLDAGNVNSVFAFDAGNVNGDNSVKQQLQRIDLTSLGTAANGTGIAVTAVRSPVNGGDGFANVGQIGASLIDLGAVSVRGDLAQIAAGDAVTATSAIVSLTVHSMGRFGTSTGAAVLQSDIQGPLGTLTVKTDVVGVIIQVFGINSSDNANGRIGRISIGGSLIGGDTANSGQISSTGNMGAVTVGGDIVGGTGDSSGRIFSGGKISGFVAGAPVGVRVGGSILGGQGDSSGQIQSVGDIGPVKVARDIVGGAGVASGHIRNLEFGTTTTGGKIASLVIGGDLRGGSGSGSGLIRTSQVTTQLTIGGSLIGGSGNASGFQVPGRVGALSINGDVIGGSGGQSASIFLGSAAKLVIGGSLKGGAETKTGYIRVTGDLGPVSIGRNIQGGAGEDSGRIETDPNGTGKILGLTVGGSLIGGDGLKSGSARSQGDFGPVKITGDIVGGTNLLSGTIQSAGNLASLTISGSLVGSVTLGANSSGSVFVSGNAGPVVITGSILGGKGVNAGHIFVGANLASLSLGGSLIGNDKDGTGSVFANNGTLGPTRIAGNIVGGSIAAGDLNGSGYIEAKRITSLFVGGSIIAGFDNSAGTLNQSGSIRSTNDVGPVMVKGSLLGNSTNPVILSARGKEVPTGTTDLAIGSLTVGGRVERANILAGYDTSLNPVNADAQIGVVTVGQDWIASNLVAGVEAGADGLFGTADDALIAEAGESPTIVARINALFINGQALGTPANVNANDHFGIVAELVQSLKIGGTALPLALGDGNDNLLLGVTGDLRLLEP